MIQRLLITGSTGLLGATLVLAAAKRHEVIAGCRQPMIDFRDAESVPLDLKDEGAMAAAVSALRPTVIVHCAAATHVDQCEDCPEMAMEVNVEGTASLARAAASVGACLVYVSTDSVFDGRHGGYTEEDIPHPLNVYARSKWLGELAVQKEAPDHVIVRTNLYGWNVAPKESLGEWILGRLRSGERISGFQDVVFSPLLVDDLVDMLLAIIGSTVRGVYHLSARDAVSKFDFARCLARQFGLDQELVIAGSVSSARLRAPRPLLTSLNPAKAEAALGRAMPTVEEGLRRFQLLEVSGEVMARRSLCLGSTVQETNRASSHLS
jgi:dTDP-4-dehydrorhamnose reductase